MSKYELRDMSGTAFKNKRKERESQPDYTGTAMVHGVEMWINVWYKGKDKNGDPWFSYAFKDKEPRQEQPKAQQADDDGDVPF